MKNLVGHTSPETAYVVADYPYGFRLRCQIRYWIETNKSGQRVWSQTTNPKKPGTVWNKPKASTYSYIKVLFLDDNGHVQNDGLHIYSTLEALVQFEHIHASALTSERDVKELALLKAVALRMAKRQLAAEGRPLE